MTPASATLFVADSAARAALKVMAPTQPRSPLMHFLFTFGPLGLFLVSIIDSSFIPLPIPGVTDVMLVLMAARHENWPLLVVIASLGSAVGGYLSYHVGKSGGIAFLEKRVPERVFRLVCDWMERHAILAVALPAILPPPMPLSPFVLAAGALRMSQRKFLSAFIISRTVRHIIAAVLGLYYGRAILHLWDRVSEEYAMPLLILIWTVILISCIIAFRQIYRTAKDVEGSRSVRSERNTTT